MTAPTSIGPARFLHEQPAQASPDLMRELLSTFIDALLSAPEWLLTRRRRAEEALTSVVATCYLP